MVLLWNSLQHTKEEKNMICMKQLIALDCNDNEESKYNVKL